MNKKIKAFVFDIDGTLFHTQENTMPQSAIDALTKLKENGYLIYIATSRCEGEYNNFEKYLNSLPLDGRISGGGASIFLKDEEVLSEYISIEDSAKVIEYCKENQLTVRYQTKDLCAFDQTPSKDGADSFIYFYDFVPATIPWNNQEVVNFLIFSNRDHYDALLPQLSAVKSIMFKHAFEITPPTSNKALAIVKLCDMVGISIDEVACFGDGENDIPMLQECGIGIAMGNAPEAVKSVADYVTSSVGENGIWNACCHFGWIKE